MNIHQPSSVIEAKSPGKGRIPKKNQVDIEDPASARWENPFVRDLETADVRYPSSFAEGEISSPTLRDLRISECLQNPVKEFLELICRLGLDREPSSSSTNRWRQTILLQGVHNCHARTTQLWEGIGGGSRVLLPMGIGDDFACFFIFRFTLVFGSLSPF